MKRLFVICIIAMTMATLHAQDYFGVQIGYTNPITRLNVGDNKNTLFPTSYHGMKIGFVYDATLWKGLGVSMGLNYTFGANVTDWTQKVSTQQGLYPQVRSRGQYHQLEIPVDWQYKFEIAQNTWIILYTGPTLQCGLALNDKWYIRLNKDSESILKEENLYSEQDMADYALKRLNVTWGIGAGFQYEKYFLRGGYDFGIINPYKAQSFNNGIYTRGRFDQWQIKLGMYLWEK
jgi:hypothetical protein